MGDCSVCPSFCDAAPTTLWTDWGWPCEMYDSLQFSRPWVEAEYLLWWNKGMDVPALVTTSPSGTAVGTAGVLGQTGTEILFGDSTLNDASNSGMRFRFGWWMGPSEVSGFEASYLFTGRQTATFQADSDTTSILARPFLDTATGDQAAMLVAHPDFLSGTITVEASTEFQAADVLYRNRLKSGARGNVDFVFGYRHARLDEHLRVDQFSRWTTSQGQIVAGTTKLLDDLFSTDTRFHGAELGLLYQERGRRWSFDLEARVGLGNSRSEILIDGMTYTSVPDGGSASIAGGLLAQETNMGRYVQNDFVVMPELSARVGFDVTRQLRATVGYNLLYWPQVARPGDLVDLNVSQLPPESITGSASPEFSLLQNGFWTQGLQFGIDYRF